MEIQKKNNEIRRTQEVKHLNVMYSMRKKGNGEKKIIKERIQENFPKLMDMSFHNRRAQ